MGSRRAASLLDAVCAHGLSLRPSRVSSRFPLAARTEREERAILLGLQSLERSLPRAQMFDVDVATAARHTAAPAPEAAPHGSRSAPPATLVAINHPGLRAMVRVARSLDSRISIDTSLRRKPPPGTPPELGDELLRVGGYYSARRACIALAPDSLWFELVHEMVHLAFDRSVRRRGEPKLAHEGGAADCGGVGGHHPLALHHAQLRARGYSDAGAEELVCREHEMYALRCSLPAADVASALLVVWDNALVDAQRDLEAGARPLHAAAARELRRVRLLRALLTSPLARVLHLMAAGVGVSCAAAALISALWPSRAPRWRLDAASTFPISSPPELPCIPGLLVCCRMGCKRVQIGNRAFTAPRTDLLLDRGISSVDAC
ncbi:hypothetical protein AB1Y20_004258 [Prymnesium parvum]|uniref:Uncharacterized protein n=1 Tax=Prymnesium parvum TaxID=97485 RepID=A0AB34J6V6_PRYPA